MGESEMKISDLITRLQEMQERHGDLDVVKDSHGADADYEVHVVGHPSLDEREDFIFQYEMTDPDFDYIVLAIEYISAMWLRTEYTFEVIAIRVNAIYGTEFKADDIQNIIYARMNKSEEQ